MTTLSQLTDQQFEIAKKKFDLVENGKDYYTNTYIDKGFVVNISYIKNPIGWLRYVEVWKI